MDDNANINKTVATKDLMASVKRITDKLEKEADDFAIPDDYAGSAIPKDVQSVFLSSAKTLDGNALTALACLGSQVVNGTNYAMLCVGETVTAEPVKNIQLAVVNKDSGGKCSVVNINTIDLEDILQDDDDNDDDDED